MPGKRARPVRREAARKRTSTKEPRRAAHPTEFGKDHFGLDHSQVRRYTALLRHTVLAMAALAVCAITAAAAATRHRPPAPLPPGPTSHHPPIPG